MRIIVTPEEMSKIDRWAIEDMGIPDILLMELAGKGTADIIIEKFSDALYWLIIAGKGNNGGDGYVVARHLVNHGFEVDIVVLGEKNTIKGSARENLEIAMQMGIPVTFIKDDEELENIYDYLDNYEGIVDAIFGTGFKGAPEGLFRKAIELINTFPGYVVSLDIPSGVNGETGEVESIAVQADVTAAICLQKTGHLLYPGRAYSGEVHTVDIGIPLHRYSGINKIVPGDGLIRMILPARPPHGHKGTFGKVLSIGGSKGMAGAISLSSLSVLKAGAGLSYAAVPYSIVNSVDSIAPEVVKVPIKEESDGKLTKEAIKSIEDYLSEVKAIIIGPGMGISPSLSSFIKDIIEKADIPVLIDADGLNNIAGEWDILENKESPIIITPHPGEYGRWVKEKGSLVDKKRLTFAIEFAARFKNHILVLKGVPTMIASNERLYINPTGNDGMATAGSGDILSGIIASFIAQGIPPLQASFLGAYIHGKAGDVAAEKKNKYSITAVDIMNNISDAINSIIKCETC